MATIFATGKADNAQIKNINDKKIQNFDKALNRVLLNLQKEWFQMGRDLQSL
jgi:glutamate N-acetyltransferase/amino-acid N-acetyltransferase